MESIQKFSDKLAVFQKALAGFISSLKIDCSGFNEELIDIVKNGRIQKFEYCTELTWKTTKIYLYTIHKIDAKSPASAMKELFLLGLINDVEYEKIMDMLDDRNKLSHEYNEDYLEVIHSKLFEYSDIMKRVFYLISKET